MEATKRQSGPVRYMERTRSYYQALGFGAPYIWAHHDDVIPFTPLAKSLTDCRVALVTTAALFRPDKGEQGPGAPYNGGAKFHEVYSHTIDGMPDVRISHIAYDRTHTSAEDSGTWFPLKHLKNAVLAGRIGGLTSYFYGLPTKRSIRETNDKDSPELLSRLIADKADVAVLVANCPVCHQSGTLAARYLEDNGIPTVVMGCAKDIVEHAGAPRFMFSDFPLGNASGRPGDPASQAQTIALALDLLESARHPGETVTSPLDWHGVSDWKRDYCNIENLTDGEILELRRNFDLQKKIAKAG